jgi:C4-dicarboxylate-specific signal transduction histidine kinase
VNLLVNAVHALSELPTERRQIRVRTERHGDEVVKVKIEDAGPGIAPEELSNDL